MIYAYYDIKSRLCILVLISSLALKLELALLGIYSLAISAYMMEICFMRLFRESIKLLK